MRKYYYYVFENETNKGCACCYSCSGSFPLTRIINFYRSKYNKYIIITFWKEISSDEFEKYNKIQFE